jgi:putative hydrolase of the HAD superfamily
VGMRTAWMQRYLDGRYRGTYGGTLRDSDNAGFKPREVGVHPCRKPSYVCAKIKTLQALRHLR